MESSGSEDMFVLSRKFWHSYNKNLMPAIQKKLADITFCMPSAGSEILISGICAVLINEMSVIGIPLLAVTV